MKEKIKHTWRQVTMYSKIVMYCITCGCVKEICEAGAKPIYIKRNKVTDKVPNCKKSKT